MTPVLTASVPSLAKVIQRLAAIPTHAFRSRATRVLASGAVLFLLYKLIRNRQKPRYVNLTAVGETGGIKGLAEYDIIIVGGGILPFLKCD